jgi:predicted dehydrogenase
MKELGVGVIGCGVISTIYMQNLVAFRGVRPVACADLLDDSARTQAERFGIRALAIEALMRDPEVDIVVNLTTPNAHFEVSHAALTAGKHVFSEKPLCVSAEDGHRLVREADRRGLKFGCAPDTFLGAGGRLAREVVDAGRVGSILAGSCFLMSHGMEHWHPNPEFFFKPGGGPILDMGPYYLAALCNLLGSVESVQAKASTGFAERVVTAEGLRKNSRITVETPTTVMALIHFASGADIVLSMSWDVWRHGHPPIELYGTKGSLRVPDPNFFGGSVEVTERGEDWQLLDSSNRLYGKPNWRSPNWPASAPDRANYRCLGIADLASSVLNGTPHRSTGAFAAHVLEVMYALLQAGADGGTVKIASRIERPAALSDDEAAIYWRGHVA